MAVKSSTAVCNGRYAATESCGALLHAHVSGARAQTKQKRSAKAQKATKSNVHNAR
eukprot:CAMPEP_0115247514 /NCGR_PEP_ID=MMETSP0270-20121206/41590_1 /TAXON_ID=71861 /ORGANISM="Scrippsiella trochoidea, Strain CCMP3099" /LENGTH=55 /DNA_ID=CAMNT_0002662779 /DNA_START=170 /DNA_END=337 /DNA_ORIENTATION=-